MYLSFNKITLDENQLTEIEISSRYNAGYVFVRTGKGDLNQTRSLRLDLNKFELSSENRRILRKTEDILLEIKPLPYSDYNYQIGKLGKDFYDTKFGQKTFSANKIKELLTDEKKSNFNRLFIYTVISNPAKRGEKSSSLKNELDSSSPQRGSLGMTDSDAVGYAICYEGRDLLHYCYPFYKLDSKIPNLGLGMMLKAIASAKENNKKYVYLGSFSRPTDTYKLQFAGLEWWDGKAWSTNLEELKKKI